MREDPADLPPSRRTPGHLFSDLRRAAAPAFAFGLTFRLALAVALTPAIGWIAAALVSRRGQVAVGNLDLAPFLLSPLGIASSFVLGVLTAAVHLLETAAYQEILARRVHGDLREGVAALRRAFASFPGILRLAARFVLGGLIRLAPFLAGGAAVYALFLTEHDVNHYLHERPPAFWQAAVLLGLLGLGAAIVLARLLARWFLALPIHRFEGLSPHASLRESVRRTQGAKGRILLAVGLWTAVVAGATTALLAAWGLLGHGLLRLVGTSGVLVTVLAAILLLGHGVLVSALGSLLSAGVAALALRFHRALGGQVTTAREAPTGKRSQALLWTVGGCLAVGLTTGVGMALAHRARPERHVGVIAHRGASISAPENSLAAIRRAAEEGAEWAEIDVQRTKDGVVIMLHDFDLMRAAGVPLRAATTSWEELRALDVGIRFGPAHAGMKIATLEEAIDTAAAAGIKLHVEMKFPDADRALVGDAVRILRAKGFADRCALASLTVDAVLLARTMAPEIPGVAILGAAAGDPTALDVNALSMSTRMATRSLVRRAHRRGLEVYVWTVNDPAEMARWLDRGVDAILTDDPAALVALRQEREHWPAWRRVLHVYETLLD